MSPFLFRVWRVVLLLAVLSAGAALAADNKQPDKQSNVVTLYAYHLKPPFITDVHKEQGLYYAFADYLNRKLGRKAARTEYLPRKRLEQLLNQADFRGVIIGVNPVWFHDPEEKKYLWTSTLMNDRDELVSLADRPIQYHGPDSLTGKRVGGVQGHYYFGIDEAVRAGQVIREDTDSELQNLTKLRVQRIDATVISRSTYDYLMRHYGGGEFYHLSDRPHDVFARRILVPYSRRDVYEWLEPLMQKLSSDPEWKAIVQSYQ